MNSELRWNLINLALPLSPFLLRIFIQLLGPSGSFTVSQVAQLPELLFYSVFVGISILNINLDSKRKNFESVLRLFILILLVLDFVTLAMIYGNQTGENVWKYTMFAAIFPAVVAPLYRRIFLVKQTSSTGR